MAFQTAAGYGNLPNGNFSPVIYSQKVQQAFRKTSVVESITNSDYFGEIALLDSFQVCQHPGKHPYSKCRGADRGVLVGFGRIWSLQFCTRELWMSFARREWQLRLQRSSMRKRNCELSPMLVS